jgi:hypothetical protein
MRGRRSRARKGTPGARGVCFLILLFFAAVGRCAPASAESYLYRATLVQAAPGKLLDLIDAYKVFFPTLTAGGDEPPIWMRHSQGDRWDLLLLFPMESYAEFFRSERNARRQRDASSVAQALPRLRDLIAWQEDVYVEGPPVKELRARAEKAGFFHVEMFEVLAGRRGDLRREREMENAYLKRLGRPENAIFVRESGAAWDLFTVGFYRDLKHYAESADIPESLQEEAARSAGFESTRAIGPYLRSLIRLHHDTLAVAVK